MDSPERDKQVRLADWFNRRPVLTICLSAVINAGLAWFLIQELLPALLGWCFLMTASMLGWWWTQREAARR